LDSSQNSISSANSTDILSHAHAAGKKVLICIGGAGSQTVFESATSGTNLSKFINNIVNFMSTRGYDGVDIDWEPLPSADFAQFTNLINGLQSALSGFSPHKLLTAAAGAYPYYADTSSAPYYSMFNTLQGKFDQINVMTYDLSGPYSGWVTWFNAPIYDGGYRFTSSGGLVPSADASVRNFIAQGVAPGKLGIGIAFYAWVWTGGAGTSTGGATQPRQSWTTAPTTSQIKYNDVMAGYYQSNLYHWDTNAQAAWLSITNPVSSSDKFISYDDQRTCQSKVSYARNRGLGGVMIWELAQDHQAGQPDPLLQAVKQALASPGTATIKLNGPDVQVGFTSMPLGSYRILWKSNFTDITWNTLATTNITGPGGLLQVTDPGATLNSSPRFYRIQTPP
jgi:chitinase